jgi:hypothetical protein
MPHITGWYDCCVQVAWVQETKAVGWLPTHHVLAVGQAARRHTVNYVLVCLAAIAAAAAAAGDSGLRGPFYCAVVQLLWGVAAAHPLDHN